jgi:EPS-associated MarR family transcriptional regulator
VTNIATSMREETYLKVMRLLQENPDLTQRELAEQLDVSVGSVNYCLKALMEKGWVKMKNFIHSKNKFGYVYVLTPTGITERAELTSKFLARKVAEYEALKHEIEVLKAEVDSKKETEQERLAS